MLARPTKTCDECGSRYFADTSQMAALCPECAHYLYGYPTCPHVLENGRCLRCYWDGSSTSFISTLKAAESAGPPSPS